MTDPYRLTIQTNFNSDVIEQTVDVVGSFGLSSEISRQVMKLRDEGVRKTLIALGWTPPPGEAQ